MPLAAERQGVSQTVMNVIKASRQRWKVALGGLLLAPSAYLAFFDAPANSHLLKLFGVLCAAGAFVFTCTAVRCPICHARWVWMAVSKQKHNAWLQWLMALEVCPSCGYGQAGKWPLDIDPALRVPPRSDAAG